VALDTEEMISEDDLVATQIMGQRTVSIVSQDMMTEVAIEVTAAEIGSTKDHDETLNYSKPLVLLVATLVKYLSDQTAQSQYCVRNVSLRRTLHQ
jgi:hypothetical protein